MHSTPTGTPLASPRASGGGGGVEEPNDLEAPLLQRQHKHVHSFAGGGGGVIQAVVFGLINTLAGVVSEQMDVGMLQLRQGQPNFSNGEPATPGTHALPPPRMTAAGADCFLRRRVQGPGLHALDRPPVQAVLLE